MSTRVFCYRASFGPFEAFGATRASAKKILEEVVRRTEGARVAARAERDAFVIPIVAGVLRGGQPVEGAGFDELPEAGGRGLAHGKRPKPCSKCRGTGSLPCRDKLCNLRLQGNKAHRHTCAICGGEGRRAVRRHR